MGAHHWSLSVAGDAHEGVGDAVASWLNRKGLEEVPADELSFEIDREIERGFFGSGVHGAVARGAITHGAGALLYEEDFEIVGRPARAVGWRWEDEKGAVTDTHCVYVQTPWLVYQFTGRAHGPATPEDLATMRSAIGTFEVVAAGA
ncbi:MAG TPA: hypothetical protein VGB87_23155 [Vicinamibacteria bacterium]